MTLLLKGGGNTIAIITNSSVDSLNLDKGKVAYAIIKDSEVSVGKGLDGTKLVPAMYWQVP